MKHSKTLFPAARQQTKADIVFCLDATASMSPCIDGLKRGLGSFAEGLQSAASVDFRLRLIAYRDLHDPACTVLGEFSEFSSDVAQFARWLAEIKAECNQKERGAESALDALYLAIHSDWRLSGTHKTIVLLTDDNSHAILHESTRAPPLDNGIARVVQDLQEMRHVMLYIVAPRFPLYEQLERSMRSAEQKIVAHFVPLDDERYKGLGEIDWVSLLQMLGEVVSASSIRTGVSDEPETDALVIQPNAKHWRKLGPPVEPKVAPEVA